MLPEVEVDPRTGAGVVAYVLERDGPPDEDGFSTSETGLWVQRLAPGGGLQGAPVRVSLEGANVDWYRPAVAFNPARGEFVIGWRELVQAPGGLTGDIVVRRLPAGTGGPVGTPVAISDSRSAIAAQAPGGVPNGAHGAGLAYDAATGGDRRRGSARAATCSRVRRRSTGNVWTLTCSRSARTTSGSPQARA